MTVPGAQSWGGEGTTWNCAGEVPEAVVTVKNTAIKLALLLLQ